MKRCLDLFLCAVALLLLGAPMLVVALGVRVTSPGSVLYWSERVGRNNVLFKMPKFRSMRIDTPTLATHLLEHPEQWLTPIGSLIRKSSLDELPQLWCILKGEMSWVGPRPALFNQQDLIDLRTQRGVQRLAPGLTGWAQVNGRDELALEQKVAFDAEYLEQQSLAFDIKIIGLTTLQALRSQGVAH